MRHITRQAILHELFNSYGIKVYGYEINIQNICGQIDIVRIVRGGKDIVFEVSADFSIDEEFFSMVVKIVKFT